MGQSYKGRQYRLRTETYQYASTTFQTASSFQGELSAAAYAMQNTGGFFTNKRMPAAASNIQQAILFRTARSMLQPGMRGEMMDGEGMDGAMRTAVCPHWNEIAIDDIYSGSAQGERYFTMHVF